SGAPIPTPTIHGDLVLVGGGFRSKEFYAFNAQNGDLAWALDLDDDGPSSAVAEDGVVVFNTESCTVFAVDAKTGKHLWSWWLGDPLTSTPAIANGRVFTSYPAGGHQGSHGAMNQLNSNHVMQQAVPHPVPQPAQVEIAGDDAVPSVPYTHVLAAFDLRTGKILWQRWIDSDVMSAPVASGNEVIAATFSGTVYKFDQRTGKILSARRSRATSAPVVAGRNMYFTQRADNGAPGQAAEAVVGQDNESGGTHYRGEAKTARYLESDVQERADYKAESQSNDAANGFGGGAPPAANSQAAAGNIGQGNVSSMQAFQGSRILNRGADNYATMGDEVVCTDAKTGKKRWSRKLDGDLEKQGGFLGTSPAAAGDSLFVATLDGSVLRIDADTGKVVKTYKVGSQVRSQPAIMNGRLYVGTTDGKLVVIDTGERSLTGWSTWGGDAQHSGTVD
ncbi:MAG: PQQ-binding-like beta-propeller repeat protein, partial [Deltaproteobacteria bacterium]|nr:PQQ-binding-like beta-propeller repeat protein [Deltaproteobacteria bacterium]